MSSTESDHLAELIQAIHERFGCGLLIVEHNMRLVMGTCNRIQVLDYGRTLSQGTPDEVRIDPLVIEAYLGSERADKHARG